MKPSVNDRYWSLMAGRPLWSAHLSDWKPTRRVKASADEWVKLRTEKLASCRVCQTPFKPTLHHLVSKSLGGDDTADNLVSLCGSGTTGCHGLVEAREPWACSLLGQRLTADERAYVVAKKGAWYLETRYGIKEAAA